MSEPVPSIPRTSGTPFEYDWPPFIEEEWLRAVRETRFFYPCAGPDLEEPLAAFGTVLSDFTFADPTYERHLHRPALADTPPGPQHRLLQERRGPDRIRRDPDRAPALIWTPVWSRETYVGSDGRELHLTRDSRHGGEVLLDRFPERSIGVFMHRGDGTGEGGSDLSFLDPGHRGYSSFHLADLAPRLADRALVVSDGSNTNVRWLSEFYSTSMTAREAHTRASRKPHEMAGFSWRCVGWLGRRNGPTLVWGLERL